MTTVKKQVRLEALQYLRSCPGRETLAGNIRVHAALKHCRDSPKAVLIGIWGIIWEMLHHRQCKTAGLDCLQAQTT